MSRHRMHRRWLLPAALLMAVYAVGISFITGCGDGRTPLVLYSPHGRNLLELLEGEFERLNPDVDVRWLVSRD